MDDSEKIAELEKRVLRLEATCQDLSLRLLNAVELQAMELQEELEESNNKEETL